MADDQVISFGEYSISGLGRIDVVMGKNGCGKSTVLKAIYRYVDQQFQGVRWDTANYITPERAGELTYEPNIEHSMSVNESWLFNSRLGNQFQQFKQQTMAQYRQLEVSVSRRFQAAHKANAELPPYFSDYVESINRLLDNVEIREESSTFKIFDRESSTEITAANISSGESELIALAIEIIVFALSVRAEKRGVLLLDSPDVHLHPDLQGRLMSFLVEVVGQFEFDIVIATHSTPVLGELVQRSGANVCLMRLRQKDLTFEPVDGLYKELLPVFGAHPLTEVFNATRTLLVEGDDDVRIWHEAMRSSTGALKVTPVGCGGLPNMSTYEERMRRIVSAVYDDGVAYSLRDRDDGQEFIDDLPPVVRMRLSCRNAENLLLADEVLSSVGLDWEQVRTRIIAWCDAENNRQHEKYPFMKVFVDDALQRKNGKLKEIRMLLVGQILASEKPWEVLVGKAIGNLCTQPAESGSKAQDSIRAYLGSKVVETLGI